MNYGKAARRSAGITRGVLRGFGMKPIKLGKRVVRAATKIGTFGASAKNFGGAVMGNFPRL